MSDYHNLQEENRRLTIENDKLKAELQAARAPKLTPKPAAANMVGNPTSYNTAAGQSGVGYIPPHHDLDQPASATRETDVP